MGWEQVATIIAANIGLFLWTVRQSRADYLHQDKKMEDNRRETNALINAIKEEVNDFHTRLCVIEEKGRK